MRIAIIGSGAAGLGAAWLLAQKHDISLYEADSKLGGHANTVDVSGPNGPVAVDTGFIVYNELNYPNLTCLFEHLGIETQRSDMSFAVSLASGRYEYEGSRSGFFGQKRNLIKPSQWLLLFEIKRFFREAPHLLTQPCSGLSLGDYLNKNGYSQDFAYDHLLPMASAIWSCSLKDILSFPATSFVNFYANHGLLQFADRPTWRSVTNGSRCYVERMAKGFRSAIRLRTPVQAVKKMERGIDVVTAGGQAERYDSVIFATHADQTLKIMGSTASPLHRKILSTFGYLPNRAVLHSDPSMMPQRRHLWASWNYLSNHRRNKEQQLAVTYWMNRLQKLDRSFPLFVTLNPYREPRPELVHAAFTYRHPQFDEHTAVAQSLLGEIQGQDGFWFCGSYCGYGFHEDALQSGLTVAEQFGVNRPWAKYFRPPSTAWRGVESLSERLRNAAE